MNNKNAYQLITFEIVYFILYFFVHTYIKNDYLKNAIFIVSDVYTHINKYNRINFLHTYNEEINCISFI